jgi:hypothetical protein
MRKLVILTLLASLALSPLAWAQDPDLEADRNERQLMVMRVRAMIDYNRANFLFLSERFSSEQQRLQTIVDQQTAEINKLTKQIEAQSKPVQ